VLWTRIGLLAGGDEVAASVSTQSASTGGASTGGASTGGASTGRPAGAGRFEAEDKMTNRAEAAAAAVSALYAEHALGLTRLALIIVGERQTAEDIVQDAFCGLHRRWHALRDTGKALPYVRSAVLNGCRSESRRSRTFLASGGRDGAYLPPVWSAESVVLATEERREVIAALSRLPARQREALLLRYFLDLSEADTAAAMRISRGTAKSTVSRGLAALRELLGESS
jgi:RNA polymerase sigma-70 factor (sigma-E family)